MSNLYPNAIAYDPRILTPLEWEDPIICTTCHERAVYEGMDECLRCFCIGADYVDPNDLEMEEAHD